MSLKIRNRRFGGDGLDVDQDLPRQIIKEVRVAELSDEVYVQELEHQDDIRRVEYP